MVSEKLGAGHQLDFTGSVKSSSRQEGNGMSLEADSSIPSYIRSTLLQPTPSVTSRYPGSGDESARVQLLPCFVCDDTCQQIPRVRTAHINPAVNTSSTSTLNSPPSLTEIIHVAVGLSAPDPRKELHKYRERGKSLSIALQEPRISPRGNQTIVSVMYLTLILSALLR